MHPKQSCLLSFIIGSILSTQVIAKYVCEVDLYQRGSGNLSASSLRGLGIHPGIVAIACVLELLKGMTAVYLQGIVGLTWCILGHIMSPWSATGRSGCGGMVLCGGLLYQSPIAVGVAILAWATLSSYGHLMSKNQYGPVCRATQNAWFNVAGGIVAAAACVVTMGELSLLHLLCIAMVALAYVSQSSAQNQEVCQIASE